MADWRTIPQLAVAWGVSLDSLRIFCRKHPAILEGAVRLGPVRALSPDDAQHLKTAFEAARRTKRPEAAHA